MPPVKDFSVINETFLQGIFQEKIRFDRIEGNTLPGRRYLFICMTPRSGSTYFSSLLEANGFLRTGEHFRMVDGDYDLKLKASGASTFEQLFNFIVKSKSSSDRFFSTKCDFMQFYPLLASGIFEKYLQDTFWVMLTREDTLAQAISLFIARRSKYFHTTDVHSRHRDKVDDVAYDFDEILWCRDLIEKIQADWTRFFDIFGVRVRTHSQYMTSAASAIADKKTLGHLS